MPPTLKDLIDASRTDVMQQRRTTEPLRLHLANDAEIPRRGRSDMYVHNDPDLIPRNARPNVTTVTEHRQMARQLLFPAPVTSFIDWNKVADAGEQIGCDWDVAYDGAGDCVVSFFFRYSQDDLDAQRANGGR